MRPSILFLYIIIGSGILFVNIYNSAIDAPNWGRDIPNSLETARNYFLKKTPGDFFKIVGRFYHILGLTTIILFWNFHPQARWYLASSFILFVLADVLTVTYFFPRNEILFIQKSLDLEAAMQAWKEWSHMNWIRSLLLFTGIILSCIALHKTYT
jgi:hypothetical protein